MLLIFEFMVLIAYFCLVEENLPKCCFLFGALQLNDELTVTVLPEYVIHGGTLYGESQLVFSIDSVKIECSDASGSDEKFACEFAVTDIDHIDCQWSESVSFTLSGVKDFTFLFLINCDGMLYFLLPQVASALVKLCFRENITSKRDKVHNNIGMVLNYIFFSFSIIYIFIPSNHYGASKFLILPSS